MHPQEVALRLIEFTRELDGLVAEYKALGEQAAAAKRDAEVGYASAYMTASGTVEVRKQHALIEAADARFTAELAERQVAACREAIRALHARIDVARTVSATTRDEMKLAGAAP